MSTSSLIKVVKDAYSKSVRRESKVPVELLRTEAMSGELTRHFYNNLLSSSEVHRFLEIGTWQGITLICGMYKNSHIECYAVDNWSQFNGDMNTVITNCTKWHTNGEHIHLIEGDCFDDSTISRVPNGIDMFIFDSDHSLESHTNSLVKYIEKCSDEFIFIVDDWNWPDVRNGTYESMKQSNIDILYELEIRTTWNDKHTPLDDAKENWWNGLYCVVCKKNNLKK
jgi:hypothetical protein